MNYQERVISERDQVLGRHTKLAFILARPDRLQCVDDAEIARLTLQLGIMKAYVDVLDARIEAF